MDLQTILFGTFMPPEDIAGSRVFRCFPGYKRQDGAGYKPPKSRPSPARDRIRQIIEDNPGITTEELMATAKRSMQAVYSAVTPLVKSGQVVRRPGPKSTGGRHRPKFYVKDYFDEHSK